jgi:hypothetical protein
MLKASVLDTAAGRHSFDADPDPTFYFNAGSGLPNHTPSLHMLENQKLVLFTELSVCLFLSFSSAS